ncbi:MAG: glutaminase [Myxococcota bacterium]
MDYQALLDAITEEVRNLPVQGDVARYIPELAEVDPTRFGLALRLLDGTTFGAGDCRVGFSVQSMVKVLLLALAVSVDADEVWSRVGVEPSGDPFNSLVQLESENGRPRNPLINAGALVVCDILLGHLRDPKAELLAFVRELGGLDHIDYDASVARSELQTSARNRALTHFMASFGNVKHDVEAVLDFYVHACAVAMSCDDVVRTYSFLAEHGVCTAAGRRVLSVTQVRRLSALMLTCGFYDEAGDFAFHVGLPGKSGVGGGIVAVCPGRFTAAAWSPRLGAKGNSILATEALRRLARRSDASVF